MLSQQSLAQGFYLGGKYHNQFFNNLSPLKVQNSSGDEITAEINDRSDQKTEGQKISEYKPDYNSPFSASIALGYAKQGKKNEYRFELEGIYSRVKVNHIDLINGPLAVYYGKAAGNESSNKDKEGYGLAINHDQIQNSSAMANVYYYWKNDRFSFAPYIGAGIGKTRMEMFEKASIRSAYQLKAGLNYRMTEDTDVYIGYRHFGVIGGTFELVAHKLETKEKKKEREAKKESLQTDNIKIASKLFTTHGLEVGVTVHFASSH